MLRRVVHSGGSTFLGPVPGFSALVFQPAPARKRAQLTKHVRIADAVRIELRHPFYTGNDPHSLSVGPATTATCSEIDPSQIAAALSPSLVPESHVQ